MFEPSSADKGSESKSISIWVEELTVPDQGWAMMGAKPNNTVVACIDADKIAQAPAQAGFQPMKAVWEKATVQNIDGTTSPNLHPGAEGHAGIWGLLQGGDSKADKAKRLALRSILADLADISPVPVPHDLVPEHISVAAYYIAESHAWTCGCHPDVHWMMAVRQLRRERVRQEKESRAD